MAAVRYDIHDRHRPNVEETYTFYEKGPLGVTINEHDYYRPKAAYFPETLSEYNETPGYWTNLFGPSKVLQINDPEILLRHLVNIHTGPVHVNEISFFLEETTFGNLLLTLFNSYCTDGRTTLLLALLRVYPLEVLRGYGDVIPFGAAMQGHTDIIDMLHDMGYDFNSVVKEESCLTVAAKEGKIDVISRLFLWGIPADNEKAFFNAVIAASLGAVDLFIMYGANWNSLDPMGHNYITRLFLQSHASIEDRLAVCKRLLDVGVKGEQAISVLEQKMRRPTLLLMAKVVPYYDLIRETILPQLS